MQLNEPYDQLPNLLQKLHSLPQDERVRQLEQELRDGLAQFDGLLQEVRKALTRFNRTADDIREMNDDKG